MKTINPFIPTVQFMQVQQVSQRERVKFGVWAVLIAHFGVVMGLLVLGCKSDPLASANQVSTPERAAMVNTPEPARPVAAVPIPTAPEPVSAASIAEKPVSPSTLPQDEPNYTVKSGDTLYSIARAHRVSIKALICANHLATDHLSVGAKLRIPENRIQLASM
jgi:LysM repeat protein